jgi:choline dehydrogenase-like flavoprotein
MAKIRKASTKLIELLNSSSRVVEIYPFINGLHKVKGIKHSWIDLFKNKYMKLNKFTQKDINLSAYHPLGTCRMGSNPKNSVIDPNFRVWDTSNLYIVDGSVFPSSTGYNPQLTIMSMGLMAGDMIHSEN